ncbi:MAG: hypothetical protein HOP33_10655 [Verrucomicrobia bacterium]|nr:hypothetical protein [Verrucomicrobiota bacterium]
MSNAFGSKRIISVLLLGLFLFVLAMTQFESLHHAVHADSQQPSHHCAATMLAGGQVDAPPPSGVNVVVSPVVFVVEFTQPSAIFVSFDFTLLPSCGPPAILS